jgi:hypothetical protein
MLLKPMKVGRGCPQPAANVQNRAVITIFHQQASPRICQCNTPSTENVGNSIQLGVCPGAPASSAKNSFAQLLIDELRLGVESSMHPRNQDKGKRRRLETSREDVSFANHETSLPETVIAPTAAGVVGLRNALARIIRNSHKP